MSRQLKNCIPILQIYLRIKNPSKKKLYLRIFEDCMIKAMREMCINLLHGNIDLSPSEKNRLERYKMGLRKLANEHTGKNTRRKFIFNTKLIQQLLPPVISTING